MGTQPKEQVCEREDFPEDFSQIVIIEGEFKKF